MNGLDMIAVRRLELVDVILQGPNFEQRDFDVLTFERVSRFGESKELLSVGIERVHLGLVRWIIVSVDKNGGKLELQVVLVTEELVELGGPPFLADWRV